jgi:hypothetical protein
MERDWGIAYSKAVMQTVKNRVRGFLKMRLSTQLGGCRLTD